MSLLNSLKIEEIATKNPNTACFIFRHLPTTMGITIGNYLRRMLGNCLGSVAPVGVTIVDKDGPVKSELTTLKGVIEITPYLILNLKKIILEEKKVKEGVFCLELKVENKTTEEKIVTANDFSKVKEVQIKNPELYLATVSPGGILEVKLYCRKGLGFHKAKIQRNYDWWKEYFSEEEDVISLDTNYSPVKIGDYEGDQVNFEVNTVVVNLNQEEEELKFTVVTNGVIKPKNALLEILQLSQNLCGKIADSISIEKREKLVEE